MSIVLYKNRMWLNYIEELSSIADKVKGPCMEMVESTLRRWEFMHGKHLNNKEEKRNDILAKNNDSMNPMLNNRNGKSNLTRNYQTNLSEVQNSSPVINRNRIVKTSDNENVEMPTFNLHEIPNNELYTDKYSDNNPFLNNNVLETIPDDNNQMYNNKQEGFEFSFNNAKCNDKQNEPIKEEPKRMFNFHAINKNNKETIKDDYLNIKQNEVEDNKERINVLEFLNSDDESPNTVEQDKNNQFMDLEELIID